MPSKVVSICLIMSFVAILVLTANDAGSQQKQTVAYDSYGKLSAVERIKVYATMSPSERMELAKKRASRWLDKYALSIEPTDSSRLKDTISGLVPDLFISDHPGPITFPDETPLLSYLANALNTDGDYLPQSESKTTELNPLFDEAPAVADPIEQIRRSERGKAWNRRLPGKGMPLTEGKVVKHVDRFLTAPFFSFEKCSHVILGTVIRQQPFLSEDKTAIYTEFRVRIEEVFKNDPVQAIAAGEDILIEREGGKLKLATGQIVELPVYGNGTMPRVESRYVFSLTSRNGAFAFAESYEIRDGLVFPLYFMNPHPEEVEANFLTSLHEALSKIR